MKRLVAFLALVAVLVLGPAPVRAENLDFEDLADLTLVGETYGYYGIHFANAIALRAGLSLNETDYPPHSGVTVISTATPGTLDIWFDSPRSVIGFYFTDESSMSLHFFVNPDFTEFIGGCGFTDSNIGTIGDASCGTYPSFRSVRILSFSDGAFTLDDIYLSPDNVPSPVPDPGSTLLLLGMGLVGLRACRKRGQ